MCDRNEQKWKMEKKNPSVHCYMISETNPIFISCFVNNCLKVGF